MSSLQNEFYKGFACFKLYFARNIKSLQNFSYKVFHNFHLFLEFVVKKLFLHKKTFSRFFLSAPRIPHIVRGNALYAAAV